MRFQMWQQGKRLFLAVSAIGLMIGSANQARADVVFSDNFTSGVDFTTNDSFWLDNNRANGFVTQTTNTSAIWPGSPGEFGNEIPQAVNPGGYFLFDGTYYYNGAGDPNVPVGHDEFYISSSFTVNPNTNYTISFYVTDANGIAPPLIQPEIDGSLLGSAVSPAGYYTDGNPADQWQKFTFTWNSGSNTSASLILHNYTTTPNGNDYGVDNIQVASATPEPSSFMVAIVGALGMIAYGQRRRKVKN